MRALKANFDPGQPRDDAGRWTAVGGINDTRVISDETPDALIPGADYAGANGHHYVPREIFGDERYELSPEARQTFENATTGRLNDPTSNTYDRMHREYNRAAREAFEDFLERNHIRPEEMTSEQARSFLQELKASREPRIRQFNMRLWLRESLHSLRRGLIGRE